MKRSSLTALIILFVCASSCRNHQQKAPEEPNGGPLLASGFGINSATLFVRNLDSARKFYAEVLGFDMSKPERFEKGVYDGTLTSVVFLPDYATIELLAVKDTPLVTKQYPFISNFLKQYEGIGAYSLSTSSADNTQYWLKAKGIKTDTVRTGRFGTTLPKGWAWDDGGPQWRVLEIKDQKPVYLPGFMEYSGFFYKELADQWRPYSWRKYYNIDRNGVVGIAALVIVVDSLSAARNRFKKLGLTELNSSDSLARFKIAHQQELQLMSPGMSGDSAARRFLQNRGAGLYAIRFEVKDLNATRDSLSKKLPAGALRMDNRSKLLVLPREFAYGVQLEFVQESKEQADLAKVYSFKEDVKLDTASSRYASTLYIKYCALCHGKEREGYAADNAPSLRSVSLMATTRKPQSSYNFLEHTVAYGRAGTAMAPYAKKQGGPLDSDQIELLLEWLYQLSGVKKPIEMSVKPISGNVSMGKQLYNQHCASCHGTKGEGVRAPALANPMLLATASDAFIHYTITEGRAGTPMPSFRDSLGKIQINALTAFIRSRASGWNAPEPVNIKEPLPKDYIINPHNKAPEIVLRQERYVPADQLLKAFKDSARMIILDARSKAAWHQSHIPGAVSVPYYEEPDKFIKNIPNDSTWVVVYCACPHAASEKVVNTLRRFGYKHTAILDEGILVWAQRGYPVQHGQTSDIKK